jgi:hypothetical protein
MLNMAVNTNMKALYSQRAQDDVEWDPLEYASQTGHLRQHAQPLHAANWRPTIDFGSTV